MQNASIITRARLVGCCAVAAALGWATVLGGCAGGHAATALETRRSDETATLTVVVERLDPPTGLLGVSVFLGPAGFPNEVEAAAYSRLVPIEDTTATIAFPEVPHGELAVAVIHDANANGVLDTNLLGIPQEGYGVSGNPGPRLGPPLYEAARFQLAGDTTTRIEIIR